MSVRASHYVVRTLPERCKGTENPFCKWLQSVAETHQRTSANAGCFPAQSRSTTTDNGGKKSNPLFVGLEIHSLLSFRASGGEMLLF